jgi:hypothetical protein
LPPRDVQSANNVHSKPPIVDSYLFGCAAEDVLLKVAVVKKLLVLPEKDELIGDFPLQVLQKLQR